MYKEKESERGSECLSDNVGRSSAAEEKVQKLCEKNRKKKYSNGGVENDSHYLEDFGRVPLLLILTLDTRLPQLSRDILL